MLRVKPCDFVKLKSGIQAAFENDTEGLKKYLDPVLTMQVSTVNEGIEEQYNKLKDFLNAGKVLHSYLVFCDNILIGYFTYQVEGEIKFLISFGISVSYRKTKNTLSDFFLKIESILGNKFCCILWDKNTRGIRWLKKNGMVVSGKTQYENHPLTILVKN